MRIWSLLALFFAGAMAQTTPQPMNVSQPYTLSLSSGQIACYYVPLQAGKDLTVYVSPLDNGDPDCLFQFFCPFNKLTPHLQCTSI